MGWALGLVGGFLEFILLKQMITAFHQGKTSRILLYWMANFFCMLGILALVLILWRGQLVACGILMALSLISSAVVLWIKQQRMSKRGN